jgi:predicted phosphodiesterase
MKLNVLSDLHLSLATLPIPTNNADAVILAGDIARPSEAIAWASRFEKPVFLVPGNHEFYGGTIAGRIEELKELSAGTNIRVLDSDEVVFEGVRLLGTTLWTDFDLFGDGEMRADAVREALRSMRDFSRIRIGGGPCAALFTPDDSVRLFHAHSMWLEKKLAEKHAGPTVVITHHAPSPRSIHPRFSGSMLNLCFVSDAEHLIDGTRACLWIHGHTHDSFDYVLNGTRVLCNPRGYPLQGVNENPLFDADLVVDVDVQYGRAKAWDDEAPAGGDDPCSEQQGILERHTE